MGSELDLLFPTLPPDWESTTLGAVCNNSGGGIQTGPFGSQLHAKDYVEYGIPVVMPKNIGENTISIQDIARINQADAERLEKYRLTPGDIVYSRRGDVEKRALVRSDQSGWLCGTGCLRARFCNPKYISSKYASYFLSHPRVRQWIVQHAVGATMPNLNTGILESVPFIRPPIEVQDRIADILGTLDDKIDLNRRMNRTLEAMARALFKSWFVDFDPVRAKQRGEAPVGVDAGTAALFPERLVDSELGEIPEGWGVKPLKEIIKLTPRYKLSKGDIAPYLGMSDAPEEGHHPQNWFDREFSGSGTKFSNGDTLMAKITPCLENGKTAFVDFLPDNTVGWGSTEYLVLRSKPPFPLEYSYYLARSQRLRQKSIKSMTGSSGRQRVSTRTFQSFQIVVPPVEIAQRFGELARDFMAKIRANNEESRTLGELRDVLLPELLGGGFI